MRTTGARNAKQPYQWNAGSQAPTEGVCATCQQVWPETWDRASKRPTPVHCTGTSIIVGRRVKQNPHHGFVKYPPCWRCNRDSGCDQCAGQYPICQHCAVHVTPEGLAAGGPIINVGAAVWKRRGIIAAAADHYPLDFQAAYRAAGHLELDAAAMRLSNSRDPLRAAVALAAEAAVEPTADELRQKQKLAGQARQIAEEEVTKNELRIALAQAEVDRLKGLPVKPYDPAVDDEENALMVAEEREVDEPIEEYEDF